MEILIGDMLKVKKQHPCGNDMFEVLRVGMDFRIRCTKCRHEVMVVRGKIEKNIKKVYRGDQVLDRTELIGRKTDVSKTQGS